MIRAASPLPPFDLAGEVDTPLPEAAVEAIAALLLDAVDGEEGGNPPPARAN